MFLELKLPKSLQHYRFSIVNCKKNIQMEIQEKIDLLRIIDEQVSSSILGGREEDYIHLENDGFIKIDRSAVQWAAAITPLGQNFLYENY